MLVLNNLVQFITSMSILAGSNVLYLDKNTGSYEIDLDSCTEQIYRTITYLMEQDETYNILAMDMERFDSFYSQYMKKFKPATKKKTAAKKITSAPKKAPPKPAESGNQLADSDQTTQEKVAETNDQDI